MAKFSGPQTNLVEPKDGAFLQWLYSHRPVYVIVNMVHHHRDRRTGQGTPSELTVQLPVQALAREYRLRRETGRDEPEIEHQNPFAPRR